MDAKDLSFEDFFNVIRISHFITKESMINSYKE